MVHPGERNAKIKPVAIHDFDRFLVGLMCSEGYLDAGSRPECCAHVTAACKTAFE
jgi:hypothetical protein